MTVRAPRLVYIRAPAEPVGIVLLVHGGQERSHRRVHDHQPAALRMAPIAGRVSALSQDRLVVVRLLHAVRGWNGAEMSPVHDAEWALDDLRRRFDPDLPISLIGHSMGGRTVLRVAGAPGVRSVVGLAPWLPEGEPTAQLSGRRVLIVHGTSDHTTDMGLSARFAKSIRPIAAQSSFVPVGHAGHSMLRRRRVFDGLAAGFAVGTLASDVPVSDSSQSETALVANLLQQVLAGRSMLDTESGPAQINWVGVTDE
jgi:pimeloyl-ACP methyl ester carboxylesterase